MTTTKDQPAALFRAEIERMLAHLDDLALMARRFGNADDPGQLDADLEVGWAYRLLQLFGSRKPLSFEDGCPGRALLLRNGIPATNVDNIAATFLSEQQGMRNGVFEEQVKARMAEFDIPDTVLNRERALTEIFRAKADVLLDVGERYPMVDRERSAFTRAAKPPAGEDTEPNASAQGHEADASIAEAENPCPASSRNADVEAHDAMSEAAPISGPMPDAEAGMNNLAPEDDEGEAALDGAEPSAAEASEISAGAGDVGSADADDTEPQEIISARGRVLPVSDFMASCEDMIANKGEEWTSDTAHDARVLIKIFQGILEEHGVAHSGEIEQFHIARLRNHFNEIPPTWGQSARLRALSPKDLREVAARQSQLAIKAGKPSPKVGLSGATIRRHLGNLDLFLHHVRSSGHEVADWTLRILRPKKKDKALIRHEQIKPAPEEVKPLFKLPIYTGCKGPLEPYLPGGQVFHSALYFLPMSLRDGLASDSAVNDERLEAYHVRGRRHELALSE